MAIVGVVALTSATAQVTVPTWPHVARYYNLQSSHSSGTAIKLAGTLCYDNYYNPPRPEVC